MKHLQTFRVFESTQDLTPGQVKFLNSYTEGTWSLNPSTGLVDVKGDFDCSGKRFKSLEGIRFGVVTDRKSTRLNSSHTDISRMPSSA